MRKSAFKIVCRTIKSRFGNVNREPCIIFKETCCHVIYFRMTVTLFRHLNCRDYNIFYFLLPNKRSEIDFFKISAKIFLLKKKQEKNSFYRFKNEINRKKCNVCGFLWIYSRSPFDLDLARRDRGCRKGPSS